MKRTIAAVLFLMTLGAGTMFADDGYWRGREIRRDEARIEHDRWELRHDLRNWYYGAARYERRELRRDYRELHRGRWDRR